VTLSRGYGRDTTGYRVAGSEDTARSIGDEPHQLFRKFGKLVHVAVGEDRVYAIPHILMEFPETRVLILDDAFQQRSIRPHLTILVTSLHRPFFRDYLLPFGRLREARSGAVRSDVIVVTKCPPDLSTDAQQEISRRVQRYAGSKPVFFSSESYDEPRPARQGYPLTDQVVLVTGIANAVSMKSYCTSRFKICRHFQYPDHHRYTRSDLEAVEQFCMGQEGGISVITTEKDMAKLDCPEFGGFLDRVHWFSLPIRQVFLQDGSKFDTTVAAAVERTPHS
jgi:tetraacyldisaccharide 4'-kinase